MLLGTCELELGNSLGNRLDQRYSEKVPLLDPANFLIYLIAVLIAITVHEWAHAYTATLLGDPTPNNYGRLTLNPVAHIDLLGALLFLVAGFGYAKPVPVNPSYFRHPKQGMLLTALAGPFSNLVLAFAAFILSVFVFRASMAEGSTAMVFASRLCDALLRVNLGLMAFNLFPIPPLDGSNVLKALLPPNLEWEYDKLMRYGPYILLFLVFFEGMLPFRPLSGFIYFVISSVTSLFWLVIGG